MSTELERLESQTLMRSLKAWTGTADEEVISGKTDAHYIWKGAKVNSRADGPV